MSDRIVPATAIFDRLLRAMQGNDLDALLAGCTEDVVFEFPFAPAGRPGRLEGRDAVHDYLAPLFARLRLVGLGEVTMHQTIEATVAIAEFTADLQPHDAARPVRNRYVGVLTVRDGRVAHYRDYWSPLGLESRSPS